MMETKWKTTVMGILGAILIVLNIVKPDIFNAENNAILVGSVNGIITAVLSIIAIFSAKDKLEQDNIL